MSHTQVTSPHQFMLPCEFHDHVPFVWGMLDGQRRLFLFDSGAQQLVLNARYLQDTPMSDGGKVMGATGQVASQYTIIEDLAFGEWRFQNTEALVLDMEHLEVEYGVEVHGMIGFRQIIHFDWMVDYQRSEIHFWKRMQKADFSIKDKIKTRYSHHLPVIDLEISGHPFRFLVDTGAGMLLLDLDKRDLVIKDVSGLELEPMTSVSDVKLEVESGMLSGFKVGALEYGSCNIKFSDLTQLQAQMGESFDGLIGYPMLSQYRTIVSWNFHTLFILEKA